jgi:2-keto-4-pentenoate hydratase/2-oxohepta-3-ene-1,7-dioic acid hydratase in catechol pathway
MRFLTFSSDQQHWPGLVIDDRRLLNLKLAFAMAARSGSGGSARPAPNDLLEVIAGGDEMLTACRDLLSIAREGGLPAAVVAVNAVSIVAPIPRPLKNVFCVGSNYRAHVSEANRAQAKADVAPKLPVFFTKPPTAVIGPGDSVLLEKSVSDKMDYEVELGIVIGKAGRNIRAEDALDHIFGFTIINDVTARDLQRAHGGQYLKGKGLDTTCPMGPQIVTIDELGNGDNLRIRSSVNGEIRQDDTTENMIFSIPVLLESLSEGLTLEPGDLLATGTPSGVGYAMEPPCYLQDGDVVSCEIEGIGELSNVIRETALSAAVS